jgi:aminoglycoside phosphotransferase (APT) family kinase protein
LDRVVPELSDSKITLSPWIDQSNPLFWRGSARLADGYVAKFAWSESAAERVWHEARVYQVLASRVPTMRTPRLVAKSSDPAFLVTEWVEGKPLTYEQVVAANSTWLEHTASEMARFLSDLHQPEVLTDMEEAIGVLPIPTPQATTDAIRRLLLPWLRADQAPLIMKWCDWADTVLEIRQTPVFVHGDLHGHNQVWAPGRPVLRVVVDFEESGVTDAAYDFRYLPAQGPGVDLLVATAARYAEASGNAIDIARVMAWNTRTVLGDALWRSEAGVPLPDGGTPSDWVDGLHSRLSELGIPT